MDKVESIQSFILNSLKTTIFKIKNNKSIIEPYIPYEWNLDSRRSKDKVLIDKYSGIILDNNKKTERFLYLNKTHSHIFDKLADIIKGTTMNIQILKGSLHINVCNKPELGEVYSNIGNFIHYIFLYILSLILETEHDLEIEDSEFIVDNADYEEDEYDISRDIKQTNEIEAQIIYDILLQIDKDTRLLDKHTQGYIRSVIEKKGETLKEETLRFVEELDKETWASLKMRINVGLDTWSSLSSKNRDLYMVDTNIGEDENIPISNDIIGNDRLQAQKELGDNYSEDQYQDWVSNRDRNRDEDMLAYHERDVMSDDDGDEY